MIPGLGSPVQKGHEFQTSLGYTASKEVSKGIRVRKRTISRGWNIAYFVLLGSLCVNVVTPWVPYRTQNFQSQEDSFTLRDSDSA